MAKKTETLTDLLIARKIASRQAFVVAAGISRRTLQNIENGTIEPIQSTIQALAIALGMPIPRVRKACEASRARNLAASA